MAVEPLVGWESTSGCTSEDFAYGVLAGIVPFAWLAWPTQSELAAAQLVALGPSACSMPQPVAVVAPLEPENDGCCLLSGSLAERTAL